MPLHSTRPATSQSTSASSPPRPTRPSPRAPPSASATASAASAATASMPIHRPRWAWAETSRSGPGGAGRRPRAAACSPARRATAATSRGVAARRAAAAPRRAGAPRAAAALAPRSPRSRGSAPRGCSTRSRGSAPRGRSTRSRGLASRPGSRRSRARGVAATAQQPRGAVVDERRAPRRAVGRAQRPRPRVQRDDGDDQEPRQGAGQKGAAQQSEPERSRPARARACEPPQRRRGAHGQQRLGELDLEGQSEQYPGAGQGPQSPAARGPGDDRGARHRQRGHDGVHRVAAGDDHRRGSHGQRQASGERRAPAQQDVQQPHQRRDERDPAERLGQQQRDAVEPEQSSRGHLQPQVHGWLVDRHAPARLERTAQERGPRRAHAAHRSVVVRVGRDAAERGEPQHGGQRQDRSLGPEAAPGAAH